MITTDKMNRSEVSILIGPYFNEEPVVYCLCQLRQKGIPVNLIGLTKDLLSGLHGLTVRPDFSLTEFSPLAGEDNAHHALIISGGHEGVAVLFSDPRVHDVITSALNKGNIVAAMLPAQQMLARIGVPSSQEATNFLAQNNLETAEFIDQILERITS